MSTVASRTLRSCPYRDSVQTWTAIVDLLTGVQDGAARRELLSVSGIASSLITDRAAEHAAIVVVSEGPRTRIYCIYDEDAIDGSDAREDALGYDPLKGAWSLSLPCPEEDLAWVTRALKAAGSRITARDLTATLGEDARADGFNKRTDTVIDREAFLKS